MGENKCISEALCFWALFLGSEKKVGNNELLKSTFSFSRYVLVSRNIVLFECGLAYGAKML